MKSIIFNTLLFFCVLSSLSFEINGIIAMLGLSVYIFLAVIISMTKLYLSFFTKNRILIYILSMVTMMFAVLDIYNDYRATTTKGAILNIRLESANKDILNSRSKIDSLTKALNGTLKDEATLDLKYGSAKKREEARASLLNAKQELGKQIELANNELKDSIRSFEMLKDKEVFHLDKAIVKSLIIIAIELILSFLLTNKTRGSDHSTYSNYTKMVDEIKSICPKYIDFDIYNFSRDKNNMIVTSIKNLENRATSEDRYFIKLLIDNEVITKAKLNYETTFSGLAVYINNKINENNKNKG